MVLVIRSPISRLGSGLRPLVVELGYGKTIYMKLDVQRTNYSINTSTICEAFNSIIQSLPLCLEIPAFCTQRTGEVKPRLDRVHCEYSSGLSSDGVDDRTEAHWFWCTLKQSFSSW